MNRQRIAAKEVLTPEGWRRDAIVEIGPDGRIAGLYNKEKEHVADLAVGALIPAPGNVHSHAFQRAMAGLTEYRANPSDDFWTWRALMYHFVGRLTPDDIEIIAAQVQMEMLEAGFAASGEFHYLHHQPDGTPYDNLSELSERLIATAAETGVGYTHLPVLYRRGGMDGRALEGGQRRFGCTRDQFQTLFETAGALIKALPADARLGVAPHSLRAVGKDDLDFAAALAPGAPIHIHIAEQTGEVEEALAHLGARPVEWLYANAEVDARWCLIHSTHMSEAEIRSVTASGAVAGLCPITEANLGDGTFPAKDFLSQDGRFGIGSDSNIRISLAEELRALEHSQRLRDRMRAILSTPEKSCGRLLLEHSAKGGAQALGRNAGRIEAGALADLVALDADDPALAGLSGDRLLDAWIFASAESPITDVWAAGRHMVRGGRHIHRDRIRERFNKVMTRLRAEL